MIPLTAPAAFGDDKHLAFPIEIFQDFPGFGIADNSARRNFDDEVTTIFTGLLLSLSRGSVFGFKLPSESKWIQRSPAECAF
jgi:hypothetical protein